MQHREEDAGPKPDRRDLLERVLAFGALVWGAGVAIPAAMFLWPAGSSGPTKRYLEIDPESVPPGTGRVVGSGGKPVLVLREPGGEFRALSAVCPHLGCIVHWDGAQGRILCPCHAGVFAADGSVVSGPPPRALPIYPSSLAGGVLRIET